VCVLVILFGNSYCVTHRTTYHMVNHYFTTKTITPITKTTAPQQAVDSPIFTTY